MIFTDQPGSEWPRPSPALEVDPWLIRMHMPIEDARAVLTSQGLAFEEWTDSRGPDYHMFTLASGVQLTFAGEDDGEPLLFSGFQQSIYETRNRTLV